jgi:hypothetical protein
MNLQRDLQDVVPDALEVVLNWDLPDTAIPDAVIGQASFMARIPPEDIRTRYPD